MAEPIQLVAHYLSAAVSEQAEPDQAARSTVREDGDLEGQHAIVHCQPRSDFGWKILPR